VTEVSQHASLGLIWGRRGGEEYAMGFTRVLRAAHERDAAFTLHHRRDGIAKELGLWSELADDGDLVRR
jgi:hypothetical protein